MPTPEGQITGTEIWKITKPAPHIEEALSEECPCFYGATCPTGGRHKDDL